MFARLPAGPDSIFAIDLQALKTLVEDPRFEGIFSRGGISPVPLWGSCVLANVGPDSFWVSSFELPPGEWLSESTRFIERSFVSGLSLSTLARCLKHPEIILEQSADGALLAVIYDVSNPSHKSLYLAVGDGIYGIRKHSPEESEKVVTRAELERELAGLARANAATDVRFSDHVSKLDPAKDFWVLMPPLRKRWSSQLSLARLQASFREGLSMSGAFRLLTTTLAQQRFREMPQLRLKLQGKTKRLPALRELVDAVKIQREGKELRFSLVRDRAQLETLLDSLKDVARLLGQGL